MDHLKIHRRIGIMGLTAFLLAGSVLPVFAAVRTAQGGGDGSFNTQQTASQATQTAQTAQTGAAVSQAPSTETVYEFDGKKYVIDYDWGCHYLTGFHPNADGSRITRSGASAKAGYTVSSTTANLGKVILVQAESATAGCSDIHRYDGLYKCEDTGGAAVENGIEKTGYVPVVDIFFDTAAEAGYVTDAGWITARVYILKEVQ